jgi:hypothetical protein
LRKYLILLFLLFGLGVSAVYAQSGGKKREKYSRKGPRRGNYLHKQYHSAGHADEFARHSKGRMNKFTRLFYKTKPSWHYHTSGSVRSANKANKFLFTRYRTKGKIENSDELYILKRLRDRQRVHGSESSRRPRKYKSRYR